MNTTTDITMPGTAGRTTTEFAVEFARRFNNPDFIVLAETEGKRFCVIDAGEH
jgi:hypothetical protein